MARNHDDDREDVGRLESEKLLRNKVKSKYLNDVVEQSELEYNEAVEMIDREKKIIDCADQGFLHSLDLTMHDKAIEKARPRTNDELEKYDNERVDSLLNASDSLVNLNRRVCSAITDASNAPDNYCSFKQTRQADKDRVKGVLAAGRRVFEREIKGLEQDTKTTNATNVTNATNESDEITTQANAIFVGHRNQNDENGNVGRSLKYVEKGVKRMTKGLDSDV